MSGICDYVGPTPFLGVDLSDSLQGAGGIGGLLARTDTNSSTFYHSDGAGNVTALMDGQEDIVARYMYGPFGKLVGQWGSLASVNEMQFSSMPRDNLSGLPFYPFRAYEPNFQRWLAQDPIQELGGINLYRFVRNNPLRWIDPLGLGEQPPVAPPSNIPVPGNPNASWAQGMAQTGKRIPFVPDQPVPGRAQPILSFDPDGGGHWDLRDGLGNNTHFDRRGNLISGDRAHSGAYRRPKSGPGSKCLGLGTGAVLGATAATVGGLGAMADNGSFQKIEADVQQGEDLDDAVFDESMNAAISTGSEETFNGLYSSYYYAKKSQGQ